MFCKPCLASIIAILLGITFVAATSSTPKPLDLGSREHKENVSPSNMPTGSAKTVELVTTPGTKLVSTPEQSVTTPATTATNNSASIWSVDDVHSMAMFRVQHLGAGMFWGRFDNVTGTISTTGATADTLAMNISIDTASVSSGNSKLDGHLKSPDFFSVKEFPAMTFKSTKAEKGADGMWLVTGDLTMRGMTKPITAKVECTGRAKMGKEERIGFEATFTVERSQFGVNYGVDKGAIGNNVGVIVGLEASPATSE